MAYDPSGLTAVVRYAPQSGDPIAFITTALIESGLKPRARGDGGHSFGLFQLNDRGRLAKYRLTPEQAYDPDTNARVSAQDFLATSRGGTVRGISLALAAQRPSDPAYRAKYAAAEPEARRIWQQYGSTIDATGTGPTGGISANPLGQGSFKLIGLPGQGTHSYSAPPNNWQSDKAVDLATPAGTPVYAPISGRVSRVTSNAGSGRFAGIAVTIEGRKSKVYLAHLSRLGPGVRVGKQVTGGDLVAYSGSANGVQHLHFGVEGAVNADEFLRRVSVGADGKYLNDLKVGQDLKGAGLAAGQDGPVALKAGERDCTWTIPIPGWPDIPIPDPICLLGKLVEAIAQKGVTALAYVVAGGLAVYLLAQGSSRALGTPAPGDVARRILPAAA